MKFEVDLANATFFKRYEDFVFRTNDNGLPDGVSKECSLSFFVQNRLQYSYILWHTTQYTMFLLVFTCNVISNVSKVLLHCNTVL